VPALAEGAGALVAGVAGAGALAAGVLATRVLALAELDAGVEVCVSGVVLPAAADASAWDAERRSLSLPPRLLSGTDVAVVPALDRWRLVLSLSRRPELCCS
jgi:hypothetical protein